MKKSYIILLLVVLLLLSACGGGISPSSSLSAPFPDQTGSSVPALSSGQTETSASNSEFSQEPAGDTTLFAPTATMEETVLVDESNVKITATGLEYTDYDVTLSLTIENNTDQDLSFRSGTSGYSCNSINGYMVDDGYLNADVTAGKKTNETVSFNVDELTLLGLTDIADIELGFSITDDQYKDYLQTGPRQVKTSLSNSYDYSADTYRRAVTDEVLTNLLGISLAQDSEEISFDQKGIHVLSQTLLTNSSGEQAMLVEVENTTSDVVYTAVGNVSLNGLGVQNGAWSVDWVGPGKRRVIIMNLSNMLDESYREMFGIGKLGTIAYSFALTDSDREALTAPQVLTLAIPGSTTSYDPSGEELYQENGIRIVAKGLAPDSFDLSDDIHMLLLVENNASETLYFDVDYNSVSVNGYMNSFLCYSRQAVPGGSAILDIELTGSSLEENGISSLEEISDVEFTIEIKNENYTTIAEPTVKFQVI